MVFFSSVLPRRSLAARSRRSSSLFSPSTQVISQALRPAQGFADVLADPYPMYQHPHGPEKCRFDWCHSLGHSRASVNTPPVQLAANSANHQADASLCRFKPV